MTGKQIVLGVFFFFSRINLINCGNFFYLRKFAKFKIMELNSSSSSSKKNENVYSASSLNLKSRMLQRKTQPRQAAFIANGSASVLNSEIRQRVLSARQHRHRGLQNQLNLAQQQNAVHIRQ